MAKGLTMSETIFFITAPRGGTGALALAGAWLDLPPFAERPLEPPPSFIFTHRLSSASSPSRKMGQEEDANGNIADNAVFTTH